MDGEPHPERIGDYVIDRLLGEGGMAKVYLARHAILDTRHAIKVLAASYRANPEVRQRFLDEAKIQASKLDHPNIVKVINVVATADHAALVMELVDGPSLDAALGELTRNPAEVRRIMLAILDAIGYAHDAGIIHRDLKPANVLLARRGDTVIPKVTDFGIAKVAGGGTTSKRSTHHDARMGTLTYSSPEQFRRAKDATARSDVFSLGAVLYEMATGVPAFAGDSDYDVMDDIVHGRYTPPAVHYPAVDPGFAAVIAKALQPDPANRYASCRDMADALRATAGVATGGEPRPAALSPDRPAARSPDAAVEAQARTPGRRAAIALGALGALAVVGGATYVVARGRTGDAGGGGGGGAAVTSSEARASRDANPGAGTIASSADAIRPLVIDDAAVAQDARPVPSTVSNAAALVPRGAPATPAKPAHPCVGVWESTTESVTVEVRFVNGAYDGSLGIHDASHRGRNCWSNFAGGTNNRIRSAYSCTYSAEPATSLSGAYDIRCSGSSITVELTDADGTHAWQFRRAK